MMINFVQHFKKCPLIIYIFVNMCESIHIWKFLNCKNFRKKVNFSILLYIYWISHGYVFCSLFVNFCLLQKKFNFVWNQMQLIRFDWCVIYNRCLKKETQRWNGNAKELCQFKNFLLFRCMGVCVYEYWDF